MAQIISNELIQEVTKLAQILAANFTPPEFIPGCEVTSIADINEYATNNGWIEAVCGQHNQQRVRWKSTASVIVGNFIDVLYFQDRGIFEAYGVGGSTAPSVGLDMAKVSKLYESDGGGPTVTVSSTGNVGIGGTPDNKLHVIGDFKIQANPSRFYIKNPTGSNSDAARHGDITFVGLKADSTEDDLAKIIAQHDGAGNDLAGRMIVQTSDAAGALTEAARIDSTQNITAAGNLTLADNKAVIADDVILRVKNTSGATAAANDVGYLVFTASSGIEYKTTTTAIDTKAEMACVVIVGAANNATIKVATRGRFTIPYAGSAPSAGDFLVFSTTAAKVQQQTTMRAEVLAVAMAAGSGGTVDALLLTGSVFVAYDNVDLLIGVDNASSSNFTALINSGGSGGLTATNVPYDTVSAGAANSIVPLNVSAGDLAKQRLYNSTRGTYRLITAVDTANSKITTVSSSDAWADNDSITIQSQTCSTGGAPFMVDLDLSQQTGIPLLARALLIGTDKKDTNSAGQYLSVHPWTTFAASKEKRADNANTTQFSFDHGIVVGLIQQRFCWRFQAGGSGTSSNRLRVEGYWLAVP